MKKNPFGFFWIDNKVNYEIYVNDFPIEKYYGSGGIGSRIEFNQAILESGEQEFTLRIFPRDEEYEETFLTLMM